MFPNVLMSGDEVPLFMGSYGIKVICSFVQVITTDVREGASRASMDAPDVGHNVMSGTK